MPTSSTAQRIGVVIVLWAGASWDGGCGCTGGARALTDHGRSADAAAVTRFNGSTPPGTGPDAQDAAGDGVVVAAAGDIACAGCAQGATADLLDGMLQTTGMAAVLPLGDEAYASGLLSEFESFYRPSWGRPELLAITHPVPGNHEYADSGDDAPARWVRLAVHPGRGRHPRWCVRLGAVSLSPRSR
jgi:hypothetical protein